MLTLIAVDYVKVGSADGHYIKRRDRKEGQFIKATLEQKKTVFFCNMLTN